MARIIILGAAGSLGRHVLRQSLAAGHDVTVVPVGGFGHHRHIRLSPDETRNSLAHEWMVIDRENPNWRAAAPHDASPLSRAGILEARSLDHQERLLDDA